jgi:hypothetical protein
MTNLHYEVDTQIFDDQIHQEVWSVFGDVRAQVYKAVMNTAEAQTRQALISLGWTPPATTQQGSKDANRP